MSNTRAIIITIGDELLIGQTIDTNSAWMAQRLNDIGVDVIRRVAVGDVAEEMKHALDEEIKAADIILLTGGLGPTADDITKPFLREYFGGEMVVDERVLAHVKSIFEVRKRPFLERNIKQAEVPDTCKVMFNRMGTAPGMLFEVDGKAIIAMPGVPFEMMAIMEDEVIPYLRQHYTSDAIVHQTILTAGEGESFIAEKIKELEEALPAHIKLAYLPSPGTVKLRLTAKGAAKDKLIKEVTLRQEEIANRLEHIVVSMRDVPLEQVLGESLVTKGLTIGLAESCTGGYVSHLLTQVVGSSQYFKGAIVCYLREVKENILGVKHSTLKAHGAVSEETAIEMAKGALKVLNTDVAISITGLLGAGGEDDNVPIGTVWMAAVSKDEVKTKQYRFFYDRPRNKDIAVQSAMLMAWKFINGKLK
jgi:nicotinamide-nucleotide amidase